MKLRDSIPEDLVRRNGGFDRSQDRWMARRNATNAGFGSSEIRNVGLPSRVVHAGISAICDRPDLQTHASHDLRAKETRRGFLRDSNLDPTPRVKKSAVRYRAERSWILVFRSQPPPFLLSSLPSILCLFFVKFIHDKHPGEIERNSLDKF